MKSKFNLLTNLLVLIVGIVLVSLHAREKVLETLVVIVGILFVVPSLVTIIYALTRKNDAPFGAFSIISAAGAMALGIALICVPSFFLNIMIISFAILLVIIGVFNLWAMIAARNVVKYNIALYIVPVLLLVGGIVLLIVPGELIQNIIVLVFGLALIAFAVNALVTDYIKDRTIKLKDADKSQDITDVEFENIKENVPTINN